MWCTRFRHARQLPPGSQLRAHSGGHSAVAAAPVTIETASTLNKPSSRRLAKFDGGPCFEVKRVHLATEIRRLEICKTSDRPLNPPPIELSLAAAAPAGWVAVGGVVVVSGGRRARLADAAAERLGGSPLPPRADW